MPPRRTPKSEAAPAAKPTEAHVEPAMEQAAAPAAKAPKKAAAPQVEKVPRCVRVTKSIKNGKVKIYGRKGIYHDGEAEHLWKHHRSHVEPFGPDAFGKE